MKEYYFSVSRKKAIMLQKKAFPRTVKDLDRNLKENGEGFFLAS